MAQVKKMRIIFKSGANVVTGYAYKAMQEISENVGKDHNVEAKNFTLNTKEVVGVFYEVEGAADAAESEAE